MKQIKMVFIILALALTSCIERKPFKKPFVIFDKQINYPEKDNCFYQYQDANGRTFGFYDVNDKYSVGDIIN